MPTIASITGQPTPTRTTARIEFVQQRNVALGRERARIQDRLDKLRGDVAKIHADIVADTLDNPERTMMILERHAAKERQLVADITRLTAKMDAS